MQDSQNAQGLMLDPMGEQAYEEFKKKIYQLTGIDLNSYKQRQMQRRINSLMENLGFHSYRDYHQMLQKDKIRYEEFVKHITINVSEFFRNPERFDDLEHKILPDLLRRSRNLRVWSAGCSAGHEPYSLAILLKELAPYGQHYLLASDIDKDSLAKANTGLYTLPELKNVPPGRLVKYFDHLGGDEYQVKPEIRQMVTFRRQNLLTETFESDFDLILCRNVIIYFTEEAKDQLYRKFHTALKPGGVLLLGGTEPLLRYRDYGFDSIGTTFYRKGGAMGGEIL